MAGHEFERISGSKWKALRDGWVISSGHRAVKCPWFLADGTRQRVAAFTEIRSPREARARKEDRFIPSEFEVTSRYLRGDGKETVGYTGPEL